MEYIKVCGLKKFEEIQLCINYGANAVGFIYNVPESPRNLEEAELSELLLKISKDIKTVLVFKPKNTSDVQEIINKIDVDLYQIHCNFDFQSLDQLSKDIKTKLIIALKIDNGNKSSVIQKINFSFNQFYAFLLDSSEGRGVIFDYNLMLEILKKTYGTRIILAGGISIDNVENIINVLNPFGIDVSSSLESEKGIKDPNKIKKFLEKVIEIKQKVAM